MPVALMAEDRTAVGEAEVPAGPELLDTRSEKSGRRAKRWGLADNSTGEGSASRPEA